jgi:methionyl-tRNA synthetase
MQYGYHCEECKETVWPAAPRVELQWLKDRQHVVREVAKHAHGGLDTWITEGLAFLDEHQAHSVYLTRKA